MNSFSHIKGVTFDLDGTLVDSLPGLAAAVDRVMQDLALPLPGEERVRSWIGNGADVLLKRAAEWAASPEYVFDAEQARILFDKHYEQTVESGSCLYPGVLETLEKFYESGMPMGVVTNKPTPFVRPLLNALGIEHYFSLIIGGDDVKVKKPHPAPLYLALATLGLRAHEMLFVGDSRNDILAARAAGCPSVGLTYGYNYGEPIAQSEPDKTADNFSDIETFIMSVD